jgi:hypothetical protein
MDGQLQALPRLLLLPSSVLRREEARTSPLEALRCAVRPLEELTLQT